MVCGNSPWIYLNPDAFHLLDFHPGSNIRILKKPGHDNRDAVHVRQILTASYNMEQSHSGMSKHIQ